MIEEYLNSRLDILMSEKKSLKKQLISIRTLLAESKSKLDDYVASNTRPFEPFYPRKEFKYDEELSSLNQNVNDISRQFDEVSASLNSVETEINTVKSCLNELKTQ